MIDTFQETYFTYDGISSKEFGVIIARTDNSMFSREFGLNRDIISEQTNHNSIPFNFGYTTEPLSGKITIAGRNNKLDTKRLSQIAKWLYKDDYKPLISNDNPDIVYYVKFTDQADLSLGNADEGYISLSFIANAPWGWTKPYIKTVDLRKNEGTATVDVYNTGNYYDYNGLEMEIELSVPFVESERDLIIPQIYKDCSYFDAEFIESGIHLKYFPTQTIPEGTQLSLGNSIEGIYVTFQETLHRGYIYIYYI